MTNEDYINAYKDEQHIIADYYKFKDVYGRTTDLSGVVNPLRIDNRQQMAPIDNQLDSPHCAGYSAASLCEFLYWKHTGKLLQLDSHQVYAKAKTLDGQRYADGTYLEASLKAMTSLCNFDFLLNAKIGTYFNEGTDKSIEYVKFLIHKFDIIQAGFLIDNGWTTVNNITCAILKGTASMGGHAVNIVGYDSLGFYIQNLWGTSWGAKGVAILPYDLFKKQFMYCAYLYGITK